MRKSIFLLVLVVFGSIQSEMSSAETIDFKKSDRLEKEILRRQELNNNAKSWGDNVSLPISRAEGIEILCAYSGLIYLETRLSGLSVHTADALGRLDLQMYYTRDTDYEIETEIKRYCDLQEPIYRINGQAEMVRCLPNPLLCEPGS